MLRGLLLFLHLVCPLVFFTDHTRNPYAVQGYLLQAGLSAALLLELAAAARRGAWTRRSTALDGPASAFLAAALLSWGVAWALHPALRPSIWNEGVRSHLFLFVNLALPFLFAARLGAQRDPAFRRAALAVGALASAYALLQYFGVEPIWDKALNPYNGRPVSTFGNPNFLSSYLVMLLPLSLLEYGEARPSSRAGWGALTLLYGAALIATMTRSSWIGGAAAVAVFLAGGPRDAARRKPLLALAGALVLMALLWPGSPLSAERQSPIGRLAELAGGVLGGGVYGSWHQRLLIWSCAWDMLRSNPLTGAGWGCFELVYPFHQGARMEGVFIAFRTHANNAHNVALEVASQAGLLGLGAAVWVAARLLAALRRSAPLSAASWAAAAALAGMLADNVFGNVSLFFAMPGFLFMWILGGLAAELSPGAPVRDVPLRRPLPAAAACVAAALSAAAIVWTFRAWRADAAYFEGYKRVQRGDLPGAERALESSRAWRRHEVNNAYELGNLHLRLARAAAGQGLSAAAQERMGKAVAAFDDALAANAGYDEIHFNRASALLSLGRTAEAAEGLRLSLLINPTHADAYRQLGALYARDEAAAAREEELMARATRRFPGDAGFWAALGRARLRLGRPGEAVEPFARALALNPDDAAMAALLDQAVRASGRPAPPAAAAPGLARDVRVLGRAERWVEARRKAEALVALAPEWPLAWLMLADLRVESGLPGESIAAYDRVLALDPRHRVAALNRAKTLLRLGRIEDARAAADALAAAFPEDPDVRAFLGALPGPV